MASLPCCNEDPTRAMSVAQQIVSAAQRHGVDPKLAVEVGIAESGLDQNAHGSAGEIGVMQLMPATARELGVNPNNALENIEGGVRYLAQQLNRFGGAAKALAAYNWGPGNVSSAIGRLGNQWLSSAPASTQRYVEKILSNLGQWSEKPVAALDQFSQGVDTFRAMDSDKKTILLLAGIAVGAYYVFNTVFADD